MIAPGLVLGFPLCLKSKCPCLFDWLYVWWIERKWHLFNFILWTCMCSSVFFCQLEIAFCVRMNRVNSASSAVLFAFPQSDVGWHMKETRTGFTTRELEKFCVVRTLLVSDIYLNAPLPISHSPDFKDVSGSFVQVRLQFLLLRNLTISLKRGVVFRTAGIGIKNAF